MDEQTALNELQYIRQIINQTKNGVLHNGMDYVVWGILIITGMLSNYFCIVNQYYFNFMWIWAILIAAGWVFSIYNNWGKKTIKVKTYAGKIIGMVWAATGLTMTVTAFIGPISGTINYTAISPLLSIMIGTAYFVTGSIVESNWFRNLAYGWWAGAILLFFTPSVESFLIMAVMTLLFETIPGLILYRKYKKIGLLH